MVDRQQEQHDRLHRELAERNPAVAEAQGLRRRSQELIDAAEALRRDTETLRQKVTHRAAS